MQVPQLSVEQRGGVRQEGNNENRISKMHQPMYQSKSMLDRKVGPKIQGQNFKLLYMKPDSQRCNDETGSWYNKHLPNLNLNPELAIQTWLKASDRNNKLNIKNIKL